MDPSSQIKMYSQSPESVLFEITPQTLLDYASHLAEQLQSRSCDTIDRVLPFSK